MAGGLVTAAPDRPSPDSSMSCWMNPLLSAPDDRHEGLVGRRELLDHGVVDPRGPDAVDLLGRDDVERLLGARRGSQPVKTSAATVDPRIVGQRLLEAGITVGVGGDAIDAAHVGDVALATQLLEQPLGSETPVGHLVVGDDIGALGGHRLVDGDHDDALLDGRLDDRVEGLAVGRVEDDRVDALGDEALEVGDLLGGPPLRLTTTTSSTTPLASASALIAQIICSRQPLPTRVLDTPIV